MKSMPILDARPAISMLPNNELDWLSDDVDIQLKNPTLNKWGENKLKSIVKKFRKEVKDDTN